MIWHLYKTLLILRFVQQGREARRSTRHEGRRVIGAGLWRGGPRAAPFLAMLFCGLLLGGCETTDGAASPDTAAEEPAESAVAALPAEPEPDIDIDDDPEQLIGLDPDAVHALLGAPALVRRENPAQVWQYPGETCIFDVVLYDEPEGKRVTYVEARDRSGNKDEARACLRQLLRARLETSAS